MKSRTLAIAGAVAALGLASAPAAAMAATTHHSAPSSAELDRSRDISGVRHADRTPERNGVDTSRDFRDR